MKTTLFSRLGTVLFSKRTIGNLLGQNGWREQSNGGGNGDTDKKAEKEPEFSIDDANPAVVAACALMLAAEGKHDKAVRAFKRLELLLAPKVLEKVRSDQAMAAAHFVFMLRHYGMNNTGIVDHITQRYGNTTDPDTFAWLQLVRMDLRQMHKHPPINPKQWGADYLRWKFGGGTVPRPTNGDWGRLP